MSTATPTSVIDVAAGLVFRNGKLLITKRYEDAHLGGLWEFPGGKREPKETFEQCVVRELREELAQPGLVIDLMTAVMILSFPILVVFMLIEGSAHLLYHRGPNWQGYIRYSICYALAAVLVIGAKRLWKRRKSNQ